MATGFQTSRTPYMTKQAYGECCQETPKKIRLSPTPSTVVRTITNPDEVVGVDGKTELEKMLKKFR